MPAMRYEVRRDARVPAVDVHGGVRGGGSVSMKVRVLVPVMVDAQLDGSGVGWWPGATFDETGASCPELDAAITADIVRRGVRHAQEQAFWATNDGAWDRHMERVEWTRDDGPEEGPEASE